MAVVHVIQNVKRATEVPIASVNPAKHHTTSIQGLLALPHVQRFIMEIHQLKYARTAHPIVKHVLEYLLTNV